jgi:hypothetical protein
MKIISGEFTEGMINDCGYSVSELGYEKAIYNSLVQLRIISTDTRILEYSEISNWERGGAETFIATAKVSTYCSAEGEREVKFIAKAIVVFGLPIHDIMEIWMERRKLLNQYINTPKFFAYRKGVIYEEYIPYSFREIWDKEPAQRNQFVKELAKVSCALDLLGFQPINIISDLRTKATSLFWVDFGEDLGGNSDRVSKNSSKTIINEIKFTEKEKAIFSESYNFFYATFASASSALNDTNQS